MVKLRNDSKRGINVLANPACFVAGGFGSGLAPISGTWGSAVGGLIFYVMSEVWGLSIPTLLSMSLCGLIWGFHLCHHAGVCFGKADHSAIVWDEVVAMFLVLCLAPRSYPALAPMINELQNLLPLSNDGANFLMGYALPFMFFRFFDIVKIPPAKHFDAHWHNGFGVMMDDVVAAFYAVAVLWVMAVWV